MKTLADLENSDIKKLTTSCTETQAALVIDFMRNSVYIPELRAAAIEWVKWFDEHGDVIKIYETEYVITPEFMAAALPPMIERQKEGNFKMALDAAKARHAIRMWIMEFFNLSESDLK